MAVGSASFLESSSAYRYNEVSPGDLLDPDEPGPAFRQAQQRVFDRDRRLINSFKKGAPSKQSPESFGSPGSKFK